MKIIPLKIPTPFYVGDVNVYVIREDPITLIDVGPKTPEAFASLSDQLGRHGLGFSDIRRIILTHTHEDHCGLTKRVRDAAGNADVFIHKWETGHLSGRLASDEHQRLLIRCGVPLNVFEGLRSMYEEISLLSDSLAHSQMNELTDEMEIEFDGGSLKVLHTPGHTPGSCSFIREADRTIFSGDCVLKRITPNPVVAPDPLDPNRRFPSLSEYLVSLARVRSFAPTLIYGGHGEKVIDFEELFHRYLRAIEERQKAVVSLVTAEGITAYDVAKVLFAASFDADVHRFLAISEAIAHLDHAVSLGKIGIESAGDVEYYTK